MKELSSIRVLWLLNHTTLRAFEMEQFRRLGIKEIFLPKFFPHDEGNLSASVDFTYDENLTIPADELRILNEQCWYENCTSEAWEIVNKYFHIAVIGFFPEQIKSAVKYFEGAIVMRAFGLAKNYTYGQLLLDTLGHQGVEKIKKIKSRFWFGAGYEHLHLIEPDWLAKRNCYLPVGLKSIESNNYWKGDDKRILFVCPRINTSPYFKHIYDEFITEFSDFDFTIAGAQPIEVKDTRVIGYVTDDEHHRNMARHRVMFYHSTEPNHIHFHPFEAVKVGMPLVFMAGGMLDKMGGAHLWGRCQSIEEAKAKINKIYHDENRLLIKKIQNEQTSLLKYLDPEYCFPHFLHSFQTIAAKLADDNLLTKKQIKIAVILPLGYRGGSLRGCISMINSIIRGANFYGDSIELVFAYLENHYDDYILADLNPKAKQRSFNWKTLTAEEARCAMYFEGHSDWVPTQKEYWIPDDGINYLLDNDLWFVISDRLDKPLLPIRPHIIKIYDYIQRYVNFLPKDYIQSLIAHAHHANFVFTTTQFTANDVSQYAGLDTKKIYKMPMLVPDFKISAGSDIDDLESKYFIWTTNLAYHKAHTEVFEALELYYETYNGQLKCLVTGVGSLLLLEHYPHLNEILKRSPLTKKNIRLMGELSEHNYKNTLSKAAFLLHNATVDNGTFSVIEAAQVGIPSLSSDYPAMREINQRFKLELTWVDNKNRKGYAESIKKMENEYRQMKKSLAVKDPRTFKHTIEEEAYYWKVIKKCL